MARDLSPDNNYGPPYAAEVGTATTAQDHLDQGLAAWTSGDLEVCKTALTAAVELGDLPLARLILGALAFAVEDMGEVQHQWERAFRKAKEADDFALAARAATCLAGLYYDVYGNESASHGWLGRADRLLDRAGRCVERGYYELALVACSVRDTSRLEESAAVALDLAIEFKDPDLEARALADGGLALINQGQLAKGFARLDEAMAAVSSGEVRDPMIGGMIYCALLTACERTGELRRAEEWTRAATDFAAKRFTGTLPILHAHCRLAYGTVLCDAGRWPEAEEQILGIVGTSSTQSIPKLAQAAGYLANLRTMQGRVDEAAEALAGYTDSFEVCEPLARLHFRKGEYDLAAAVISRSLHELVGDRLRAGKLLALLVDVELARGSIDAADRAAERLADYASDSDSSILRAESHLADGRVAEARGDMQAATKSFESGIDQLSREERPVLIATLRLELAQAVASNDVARATDEGRVALATFERLGAPREIERAAELLRHIGSPATVA